ncbi:hypothetical protein HKBW3S03_01333 [Candidatus Hakubella thermalkaliphila]|uniref:MoaD/ThiS family protein n=2 Tax=Candidatus Hakubella thermalkaliphila TaxID=2754717 RepID=A0A6V8PE38_9ACTN|nr:MoaD/ThiS family protein [Candidatus Hakubella thermalkaliphila]MBT9170741.1 hypothetical protein [Actinomycetota bacterium]GFP19829.1 hypothetical protein HKBW3S03_01333 [Candidatus Hakubella thermalkaliphila]GFP21523.1 hypothetical protein HKBW3S06_00750 [Candidatus Hakubella thermalkaliphila]GFP23907.1 hypothetical protein HKBW3S09_01373 [Candidatus Hakubella thermalkaliphila]GFP26867.1 hypothetical protein HKBW3S33_00281 [Candidatus Hakubella thermalkaliphila]
MVKIKLYGRAKELVGKEELNLKIEGQITLEELTKRIAKDWGKISSREAQTILINGRNCIFMEGLQTQIKDSDLVEILPIISGG